MSYKFVHLLGFYQAYVLFMRIVPVLIDDSKQVLTNGIEVKLQRNALSVIEAPTGNEEDDDLDFENVQWNGSDMGEFGCDSEDMLILSHPFHVLICLSKAD